MPLNKGQVSQYNMLTHDVLEIGFKTDHDFNFVAGQYVSFKVNDGQPGICFRPYSIASRPGEQAQEFVVTLKIVENGRGSNWLKSLKEGGEVEFMGPIGEFTHKGKPGKTNIFVATGTGITPLRSMILDLLETQKSQDPIHLIFGVRHFKDLFYKEFFDQLAEKYDNFTFSMCLSKPECEAHGCFCGRVTNKLEELELDKDNTEVYICGLNAMIQSVVELLKEKGLPEEAIHFEKYD